MEIAVKKIDESTIEVTKTSIISINELFDYKETLERQIQQEQEQLFLLQQQLDNLNERLSVYQKATDKNTPIDELKEGIKR